MPRTPRVPGTGAGRTTPVARVLAVSFALALLAGCGGTSEQGSLATAVPDGHHRITGEAVSRDDTGLPDSPMTDTTFALLPDAVVDDVWVAAGLDHVADQHQLPYLVAELDAGILDEAILTRTGRRGGFTLDAPGGEHLLCQVGAAVHREGSGQTADPSRWTTGCDVVTVDGPTTWRVTHGEGGVHVIDEG